MRKFIIVFVCLWASIASSDFEVSGINTGDVTTSAPGINLAAQVISHDLSPSAGNPTLEESEDALQVKYDASLVESASGLGVAAEHGGSLHHAQSHAFQSPDHTGLIDVLDLDTSVTKLELDNLSNTNSGDEFTATQTNEGIIEIADAGEVTTATANDRAITPLRLEGWDGSVNIDVLGAPTATKPALDNNSLLVPTTSWVQDETVNPAGNVNGTLGSGLTIDGDAVGAVELSATAIQAGDFPVQGIDGDDVAITIAGRSLSMDTVASPDEIDADEELYRDEFAIIIQSGNMAAGEELLQKASGAITLKSLDCSANGATTANVTVNVVECTSAGQTCVSNTTAALAVTSNTANFNTTTFGGSGGAVIDDGDWWGIELAAITAESEFLFCTVEYTRND